MESEAVVSVKRPVNFVKRPKVDCDLDQIITEIHTAAQESRQFSLSSAVRQQLITTHGPEKVTEIIFKAIRDTNTSIVDPFNPQRDIQHLITSVIAEASISITSKQVAWSPQGSTTVYEAGEVILLTCSTNTAELSSYLSGDVRYQQKISKKSSATGAWDNDQNLKAVILGNLSRTGNSGTALSRNNIKTSCKLYGNCEYPSSFPISAVIWIVRREAERRPEKKLLRFIDPCAGWGDRVAGAILAGPTVLEHYVGIDPWTVSHELCQRTVDKLAPKSGPSVKVSLLAKGAEDQSEPWPDADLVFTSPPYAKKECYNCASNDPNDGQAWRLCDEKKFTSHFLEPMMQNAAQATKSRKGRVIINVSNTDFKHRGGTLVDDVIDSGEKAGLTLVEIFGLRIGTRSYNVQSRQNKVARGDPFLVFEHVP
jgi:hypothetical protein